VEDIFVPEEEKAFYFLASDVAILSYKKNFIQSASIINDAAKFSTPVIASDVGQLGEFVRTHNLGITFTPEDPHSLRQAIFSFLQLPDEERKAIKENFARFRAAYSWEENARQHLEIYQRLGNEAQNCLPQLRSSNLCRK
jgi:glycosyltransferase involved in cell wall biosynthesis